MNTYRYPFSEKLRFYLSYFFYKLILPLEMKKPRLKMWLYEWVYSLLKFKDYKLSIPYFFKDRIIHTRFGQFEIRPNTSDAANVSPAFERRDVNLMMKLIEKQLARGKHVLFLDIGGDVGTYSVTMARRFAKYGLKTICFEPSPRSAALIRRNLEANGVETAVEVIEKALFDADGQKLTLDVNLVNPGSSSMTEKGKVIETITVETARLDTLLKGRAAEFDTIFMKIDVEGVEEQVLKGATGLTGGKAEVIVVLEDFVKDSIITYMKSVNASFMAKKTDYNSWWKL